MTTFHVYQAPGWHGQPDDPCILVTHDEREAAMRAGERADLRMPGDCNQYDAYAEDADGNRVEPIESFCCDACGKLAEWGEHGPTAMKDGEIAEGMETHLVDWVCDDCFERSEASPY